MWKFICAFVALLPVSGGDGQVNIKGVLGENVLLPCSCPNATVNDEFRWQNDDSMEKVYDNKSDKVSDSYRNRSKIFLPQDNNNCSLLLTNITADDQGRYRCSFMDKKRYQKVFVNLNVSTTFDVCQINMSLGVFQCNATGRYKEAEIQWDLDGRLLTDSPSINLNSKKTLDASTGTYHFTSTLNIKTNESLTPTCNIKAKRISVTQTRVCKPSPSASMVEEPKRHHNFLLISCGLFVSFLVFYTWKRLKRGIEGRE